jgi:ATP-binding protein involved in chromosome partitioning
VAEIEVLAATIPSAESFDAVQRALTLARERGMRLLGVIENMVGHSCPACGQGAELFPGDAGQQIAEAFDLGLLARLPMAPQQPALDELAAAVARPLGLP